MIFFGILLPRLEIIAVCKGVWKILARHWTAFFSSFFFSVKGGVWLILNLLILFSYTHDTQWGGRLIFIISI